MTSTDSPSTSAGPVPARQAASEADGQPRRRTRQRDAIADYLAGRDDFRTAQEIHADLRATGTSIGLATIYRTLQSMAEAGEVDALRMDDGEQRYRCCVEVRHHHHLVCRSCGVAVEVRDEPVDRWAAQVGAEHGFSGVEHRVEVFGVCPACG
ncbi:MAG: Fur family transcriptional regulator [Actinomycetales bacterium]